MASSVNPSIEEVETRLAAFQSKLVTYGRDMFGEDFVISALAGETGGGRSDATDAERGSSRRAAAAAATAAPSTATTPNANGPSKKKRDSAKTVLQRFLEDREELVRLRVISKAATERTHERISAAENRVKQLSSMLEESERRRRVDVSNSTAFLSELRKKLTAVERTQRRLLALVTRKDGDEEVLDRMLAKQVALEAVENGTAPELALAADPDESAQGLEDTLAALSSELKEIERNMALFASFSSASSAPRV